MEKAWWHSGVVYQIYPRSFKDSNGDGIGDIVGIIEKLAYLQDLGVSILWLTPIFDSPNDDNGYDVRDYGNILNDFGSMEDFEDLLRRAHGLGMRIILDMVINHTSDEHPWFIESRSSCDNPKRNYYIWRTGVKDSTPNNWGSFFSPSAWEFDEASEQYYLHLFSKKQPDLNWDNTAVQEEIFAMMRWWLDKGVDGFRLDVIDKIKKPIGLPDSTKPPTCSDGFVLDPGLYANNPGLLPLLEELQSQVFSDHGAVTIGECGSATPYEANAYASVDGTALSMIIHFELISKKSGWTVKDIRDIQLRWYENTWKKSWFGQYLSNHDQPRQVSIFGNETTFRIEAAKLLGTMIHTLPGIPFVYQGEEIGMTNTRFSRIEEFRDIRAKFKYSELIKGGATEEEAIAWLNRFSRDHARTPMQWDESMYAGFSTHVPWIKVNENYPEIHVKQQLADKKSVLNYYKALIKMRKEESILVYGDYEDISPKDGDVYSYLRIYQDTTWLILLNLSDQESPLDMNIRSLLNRSRSLLTNYEQSIQVCPPWYAGIYEVESNHID